MRLIDADTLLEAIDTKCKRYFNSIGITDYDYEKADEQSKWISDGAAMAAEAVLALPTIDAVKVVRCRDCRWYEIYQLKKDGTDDRRYKPSYCTLLRHRFKPDWYCADGEAREE